MLDEKNLMTKKITSLQNKVLKGVLDLQKSRLRKKSNLFGVEGSREISMALNNNFTPKQVFSAQSF